MATKELFEVLQSLIFKLSVLDEQEDRDELKERALKVLSMLIKNYEGALETINDLSTKALNIVRENKELKRKIKYYEIAAGDTLLAEINETIKCMKAAVKYEEERSEDN